MSNLQDSADDERLAVYFNSRDLKKVALVVITSDRGLCGAFNSNVVKRTRALLENDYRSLVQSGNVDIICIGKKGAETLKRLGYNVNTSYQGLLLDLNAQNAFDFAETVIQRFRSNEIDKVEVIYNQFKNAATQILSSEQFLPINTATLNNDSSKKNDYLFEPNKEEILLELIPRILKTQLFRCMLDSLASEHGARMIAMDKATDNAGELLKSLKIEYNRVRQAAITTEISEIVGGAAALSA
jgi:F-type H+-transporting ATPase subunit gamma